MKYLIAPGPPLALGGVTYAPGDPVEIFGRDQAQYFGDRLIPVTDPALIRALDVNAHPFYAREAFRYGRHDYRPGDIMFLATRAQARSLGELIRPASGEEVVAWVNALDATREAAQEQRARQRPTPPVEPPTAPPSPDKPRRGRPPRQAVP